MSTFTTEIRAILFDLDGTLVDTEVAAARAVEGVFRSWGYAATRDDAHVVAGKTWATAFDVLFKKYPPPVSRSDAEAVVMSAYREEIRRHLTIVPGAAECVQAFSQAGYECVIVSGSNRTEIQFAVDRLKIAPFLRFFLGAEDYARSKPAPDGYLKAIQMLGLAAEQCLVFEDSLPGIHSGRTAGCPVVAISSTNHFGHDQSMAQDSIEDLRGVNPDWLTQKRGTWK